MSNFVQGLAWNAEIRHPHAKSIAAKLADWADDDGGSIFPAVATVARMTALARSTVCQWQAALEHCGLLKVVTRSQGGSQDDRTERAFDMDLLRRIAWAKKAGKLVEPELMLVEAKIERAGTDKKGNPKVVKVTVLKAVPYAERQSTDEGDKPKPAARKKTPKSAPATSAEDDTPPVRDPDGSEPDTRPGHGRVPVRVTDGTRPGHGHEPSVNRQSQPIPKLPTASDAARDPPRKVEFAEGAGDRLIPFDVTDPATVLAAGRAAALRQMLGDAFDCIERLPFTYDLLRKIQRLNVDPKALVERYLDKTRKRKPRDPCAYLMRMAQDVVAKRDGVPIEAVAALTSSSPAERASATAAVLGLQPEPPKRSQRSTRYEEIAARARQAKTVEAA